MAKHILSAPASEAEVERIFSVARQVCPHKHNRLDGQAIQQIMMVRQYDKMMKVYTAGDINEDGEVAQAKKDSVKLSERDYFSGLCFEISGDEDGEDEEKNSSPGAPLKKRTRSDNKHVG